jgi:hypothetical protein
MPESLATSIKGSKAEYVRLGKSGLKVSVPIFGTMSIGDPGWIDWVEGEEKVCLLFHSTQNFPHKLYGRMLTYDSLYPSSKQPTILASTPGIPPMSIPTVQVRFWSERRLRNIISREIRFKC